MGDDDGVAVTLLHTGGSINEATIGDARLWRKLIGD
jgi:hypothetical protein